MNKLQKESKALTRRLQPVIEEVAGLVAGGMPAAQAFEEANYYAIVEEEVLNSVTVAADVATAGTVFSIDSAAYRDWYLDTNHLGGKLSENIRSGYQVQEINKILRKGMKIDNNVLQLSDAIGAQQEARIPQVMRELIQTVNGTGTPTEVRAAIKDAQKYVNGLSGGPTRGSQQLKNSYKRLVREAEKGEISQKYIDYASQRKMRYMNETIAQTEMANSYEMTRRRAYEEDEGVIEFEWILSGEHPIYDECDYLAEADLEGRGAGIHSLESGVTCPAHPRCLCTTLPRRRSKNESGRYSEERSREYIAGLSDKNRTRLIGAGTPLSESQQALKRKGIDPKAPTRAMIPKNLLTPEEGK